MNTSASQAWRQPGIASGAAADRNLSSERNGLGGVMEDSENIRYPFGLTALPGDILVPELPRSSPGTLLILVREHELAAECGWVLQPAHPA